MKRAFVVTALLCGGLAVASPGLAVYTLFQHGGQGAAQVGAFTARAEGAGAIHYNPAALAQSEGRQIQLGLDFAAPRDDFESSAGDTPANHVITFTPALYASWRSEGSSFAFGLGLDSDMWHLVEWDTALFPERFRTRRQEVTVFDLHPVVAYRVSDRWGAALGVHYYRGTLGFGDNRIAEIDGTSTTFPVEVERLAEATADGYGFDLSLHYAGDAGGWGLVLDSGGEIDGSGDLGYEARDVPNDPVVREAVDRLFVPGEASLSFDLPWSVRTGFWWAVRPAFRIEIDLALTGWSQIDETVVLYRPDPFTGATEDTLVQERSWDDTVSLHLGAEGDVGEDWIVSGGLAWVPSPVPEETLDPGFPRGDAIVVGLGFGYRSGPFRFDAGYSFHHHDDVSRTSPLTVFPPLETTYSARNQAFGFSIGWSSP